MLFSTPPNCHKADLAPSSYDVLNMKMLFSPSDRSAVKLMRKKLAAAGIQCEIRRIPLAEGLFGTPPSPQLWITEEGDILRALKILGTRRLNQMTVIFPTLQGSLELENGTAA
jgi:hypothetical protein